MGTDKVQLGSSTLSPAMEGRLALSLLRLAAELLEAKGELQVLDTGWVDRHVRPARITNMEAPEGAGS